MGECENQRSRVIKREGERIGGIESGRKKGRGKDRNRAENGERKGGTRMGERGERDREMQKKPE